ncbi:MAG: hypothetical protein HGB12_06945, partial [Bacteroidetes bacterium]|nr:hypothetical protein [Bacteroidota bacterium]
MKIKKLHYRNYQIIISIVFILCAFDCFSQVGGAAFNITGSAADNSAILDMSSNKQGVLIPRMSTIERDLIIGTNGVAGDPPALGLQIYNTTTNCLEIYIGSTWQAVVCGCTSAPAAAGTIIGTAAVCPGQSAVLYSVPAIDRATTYMWSYSGIGASIVGSTNTVIVYFSGAATSGNLTVKGINACGNGTVSADFPISVNSTAPNITAQPLSAATCLEDGVATYTVTATGGLTYQWQEFIISWNNVANAGVYSNVNTATLTVTNPTSGMNGNKYRCIVSGTCTSTTSDGEAALTVNPIPSVTNASIAYICSGASPNITLTSSAPSNFAWTVGTITGSITGAGDGSGSTINQTLTNPSNATTGSVQYIVTPTSTAGSCEGAAFTITVTVNPILTVDQPSNQTVCNAKSTTAVNFSGAVSGTIYTWTNNTTSIGLAASGTGNIASFTAINTGISAVTASVTVTPFYTNGGVTCTGSSKNFTITVNPTNTCTAANNCTQTINGSYTVNTFTTVGANTWIVPCGVTQIECLVVAGGGSGGSGNYSGGGGGGGLLYNSALAVTEQSYTVTVGAGGANSNGQNSSFGTLLTAIGGGKGGSSGFVGSDGGAGGGGGYSCPSGYYGGNGTSGQGYGGGRGNSTCGYGWGGGGGGAGGVGSNAIHTGNPGNGGVGLAYSISGTSTYYSGGGGGAIDTQGYRSYGGNGGGGWVNSTSTPNNPGTNGTANTGGGG